MSIRLLTQARCRDTGLMLARRRAKRCHRQAFSRLRAKITFAQSAVGLSSENKVPQTAARQLRRYQSDTQVQDEQAKKTTETERQEAFAAVQKHRAKYVGIVAPKDRSMSDARYQDMFEASKVSNAAREKATLEAGVGASQCMKEHPMMFLRL